MKYNRKGISQQKVRFATKLTNYNKIVNIPFENIELMRSNPFNVTFGINPTKRVERNAELFEIVDSFEHEENGSHVFIITGPRGSGKTALLSLCKKTFEEKDDWISFDVNPLENIQSQVAAAIYNKCKMKHLFTSAEFNFSFHGFGISIEGKEPVSDLSSLLERMFEYLKKKEIKVFIALDEASNSKNLKSFIHTFQILLRNGYPIYFLLTGLYQNISLLANNKTLTFLYRAPKIDLMPLDSRLIAKSYAEIFEIDIDSAIELARFTKGYAFAYQLLGSLLWNFNRKEIDEEIIYTFDSLIASRSYNKIWEDLPNKEKEILIELSKLDDMTNSSLKDALNIKTNELSVYKTRLMNKGIILCKERSKISFVLPRFKEFIQNRYFYENELD